MEKQVSVSVHSLPNPRPYQRRDHKKAHNEAKGNDVEFWRQS